VARLAGQILNKTGDSAEKANRLPHFVPVSRVLFPRCRSAQAASKEFIQHQQVARIDPLYLFHCGVLWHAESDASSGWELIQGLRSSDGEARAVAATLLSRTENARLLVRDLRRTRRDTQHPGGRAYASVREKSSETNEAVPMNTPYRLEVIESCLTCQLRKDKWFCGLSPEVLKSFSAASRPATYPGGAVLFVEGQTSRNALVLCSGKAKLSTTSRDGKVLILKVAEAGDVLGLSATITGTPYEVTAETVGPCHVNFVEREPLLRLMERNGEMGMHAAQALSTEFQSMYRDIHELVLARSSAGKLARLLLSWSGARGQDLASSEVRIRAIMTHEEMAQMIGASRETVTRLLSELKKKELIRLEGATLVIRNRVALEAIAA
jgi:CRP/FNR family transcriptional regulator, cyclic AMP receptor protein